MICDCCRRNVDDVKASFWHGEAMMCRECFAQWCDPDNVHIGADDAASVGNYVRLQHGLPPLAAALVALLLTGTPPAHASRHCLDHARAARTWPARMLAKDDDGCWTYDHHSPLVQVPVAVPETPVPVQEATLADRWAEANMLQVELRELEPERISEPPSPEEPLVSASQFALFVSLVLATASVVEVATGGRASRARRPRWPDWKAR
ncbi:MAG TPA: hypothetical protein VKR55_03535 [Bradyrhizobium sp.]|uniref:hypothetical protein n=1 Tax=Bradyrhizobium sp. TaxID=376 RepID=UPI002BBC126B|nr:hypothetical protein [Bradyrhizobium sp.]HLZ01206.1 hypothetical protein [Bradyrhizobium sp.]